jgi:hypothetical protein
MTKVIGSQTDVPDVGDPIVSPWYQDTSTKLVHRFASLAALNAWTTAPAGAHAYTTDTSTAYVWMGGMWRTNTPRGLLGFAMATADQTGIQTAPVDIAGMSVGPLTIPSGRYIRVEAQVGIYKGAGDTGGWGLLTICRADNSILVGRNQMLASAMYSTVTAIWLANGTLSGSVTIKARMQTNVSYINTSATSQIAVYDEGWV